MLHNSKRLSIFLSSIVTALMASPQLHAQSVGELMSQVDPAELAAAFIGHCFLNQGDVARVTEVANVLEYVELEPEVMSAFGSLDGGPDQIGWIATSGEGAPYLLGVNRAELDGQLIDICTVSNPYLEPSAVTEAWEAKAGDIELLFGETRFGQRERLWNIKDWVQDAQVFAVEGTQEAGGGITLSLFVPTTE